MNINLKIKPAKKEKQDDDFTDAFTEPAFDSSGLGSKMDQLAKHLETLARKDSRPAGKVPEGYRSIQRYPLIPPFCYASILQSDEYSDMIYSVDELEMNEEEAKIYHGMKDMMERQIDSPRLLDNVEMSFAGETTRLLSKHFSGDYLPVSVEKVKYCLKRDILGFGLIDPLFHDPFIEDITCGGPAKPIFVYHRYFEGLGTNLTFRDEEALDSFVMKMVHRAGKHVSAAHPIVDASLPGNHRLAALYKKEVTTAGSSFTIRKFREDPLTIVDLINSDVLDVDMAAYAWLMLDNKKSLMVIGSTGGGKTTILNAVTGLINPSYKIFTVEDVAEINIPHVNWFSLVSRASFGLESQGEIGLFDLLKSGMRHRPDYILVGEIRGEEAYVLFQAVATGHGGIATMHADDSEAAIRRLQQKPMDIPPAYVPLMNCIITVKRVKLKTEQVGGRSSNVMARRVTEVTEVLSHNSLTSVFSWNPEYDGYLDNLSKSRHLPKIALDTGVDMDDIREDLARRRDILNWLQTRGIRDYRGISRVIGMFNQERDRLMERVKST